MPGSTPALIAITEATIARNCASSCAASKWLAGVGGGPPVLLNRMSIGPASASIAARWPGTASRSPRSQTRVVAVAPIASSRASVACSGPALRPAATMRTPSRASASQTAEPRPPPAPRTSAVRPEMP